MINQNAIKQKANYGKKLNKVKMPNKTQIGWNNQLGTTFQVVRSGQKYGWLFSDNNAPLSVLFFTGLSSTIQRSTTLNEGSQNLWSQN